MILKSRQLLAPFALAAVLSFGVAAAHAQEGPSEQFYEFELVLAPVDLNGTFSVEVDSQVGPRAGTLELSSDIKGRLTGTLALAGTDYEVTGRAKSSAKGDTIAIVAKAGKSKLLLKAELLGREYVGTAKGRKVLGKGAFEFTMDVRGSTPQRALIEARVEDGKRGKLGGGGTLTVGDSQLELKASGKRGKKFALSLKAKGFKFKGVGRDLDDVAVLDWTAKGWGAKAADSELVLKTLAAPTAIVYTAPDALYETEDPIQPNVPAAEGSPATLWEVTPALPEGLRLNPTSGVISGTPTVVIAPGEYTVTATNLAGSDTATLQLGVRINRAFSLNPHTDPLTDGDVAHLLRRTAFGYTPELAQKLADDGLSDYVDDMLVFEVDETLEAAAQVQLEDARDPAGLEGKFPSRTDLARWWTHLMLHNDNPFQESLAFFWHDHFAISTDVLASNEYYWMQDYVNHLRHHGSGNFRELLVDISAEPAMIKFLDGFRSTRNAPNENFAREFWELYTLGVDNGYTQADIEEAARAFTGYRTRNDDATGLRILVQQDSRHDFGEKTFLGRTVPADQTIDEDYQSVVDITLAERDAAEYICRKLFEWYVYDDPSDELIAELATTFRNSGVSRDGKVGYDISAVLRQMFNSEAFFSKRARGAFVKSPVDFGIGLVRSTGLEIGNSLMEARLADMGQRQTEPPTVDGWPGGSLWLSAQALLQRTNLAHVATIGYASLQAGVGIELTSLVPDPADGQSLSEVAVDTFVERLSVDVTPQDRADLIAFLDTAPVEDGDPVASPLDEADAPTLEARLRDLVYVLAQHPTYHVR